MKRKNVIILIIGIMIGVTVSVYATNTILSRTDISYDNSVSGLSSSSIQDAIDELYDEANMCKLTCPDFHTCTLNTAVETIMALADGADTTSTDEITGTGLAYDGTTDNNLRYIGSDPNNYVTFNGETWRIIGVMNNVSDGTTTESRVKLIRSESLGSYSWNSSDSTINSGYGVNDWSQAALMYELNGDYLDTSLTANTYWYYTENNGKTAEFDYTKVLSNSAQNMIEDAIWNLGGDKESNKASITENYMYTIERGTTTYSGNASSWTSKVALIYPSDYGYATAGGSSTDRTTCLSSSMYNWNLSSLSDCINENWLYNSEYEWVITHNTQYPSLAFRITYDGSIAGYSSAYIGYHIQIYPSVYLKSSIKITSGSGTSDDPYQLAL